MTTKATQENMVVHYQQKLTKCRTLGWCNVVAYQQKIMWLFVCRSIALSVTPRTPEKGCRENSDATTYWWNWLDPAVLGRRCQYSASIDTGLMMLCPIWQDSIRTPTLSMHNCTLSCASSLALFVQPLFHGCRFWLTSNLQLCDV